MIYDPEANIISWEVAKGEIHHAREIANFIIHMSKSGKPILIEMLDASDFKGQFENIKNVKEIKKIMPTA